MPQSSPITAAIATLPVATLSVSAMGRWGMQMMERVFTAAPVTDGAAVSGLAFPQAP